MLGRKKKLKLIPEKCYEVKSAASLIPLTQPKLSAQILKLNLVRHMRIGQNWISQTKFKQYLKKLKPICLPEFH